MDNPDSDNLIYTSYEKNGSVNQYPENDDGGHGHHHWDNKNDHDLGRDANSGRDANLKNFYKQDIKKITC